MTNNANGHAGGRRYTGGPQTPALVEYKHLKFIIINQPTAATLPIFIEELKQLNAGIVVRCCESTYSPKTLAENGIQVVDLQIVDGAPPSNEIIENWLSLVATAFEESPEKYIAVHCVAGLGRAPVLVAIALIEYGMKYADAVEFIRERRRGAINAKQLAFLEKYRPKGLWLKRKEKECSIM